VLVVDALTGVELLARLRAIAHSQAFLRRLRAVSMAWTVLTV
jgi:hypothetical protein